MDRPFNEVGAWCYGDYGLCEHNLEDAPLIRRFVCSGIGGKCIKGSAYSMPFGVSVVSTPYTKKPRGHLDET